jgi:1,4-alpha-glucan branching enzyme
MYWTTEFMFDGFRFDGVTSILYALARSETLLWHLMILFEVVWK